MFTSCVLFDQVFHNMDTYSLLSFLDNDLSHNEYNWRTKIDYKIYSVSCSRQKFYKPGIEPYRYPLLTRCIVP